MRLRPVPVRSLIFSRKCWTITNYLYCIIISIHRATRKSKKQPLTTHRLILWGTRWPKKVPQTLKSIFSMDEIEFESRCHFYRVRIVERNRNPHSLQLTGSMGGHHFLTPDSKSRCLTIFLTKLTFFISCRIYMVNSSRRADSNALFIFFNRYREPPFLKTTPVHV